MKNKLLILLMVVVMVLAGCADNSIDTIETTAGVETIECTHEFTYDVVNPASALQDGLAQNVCSICGTKEDIVIPATKSIKILAIGHSFSEDSVAYLWDICNSAGIEEIVVGNLYIGNCSMERHVNNVRNNLPEYMYYKFTNSSVRSETAEVTVEQGLSDELWDVITVNGHSYEFTNWEKFNELLDELLTYVDSNIVNPDTKVYYLMTWAYDKGCTYPFFSYFDWDQKTHYDTIIDAVSKLDNDKLDGIIPSGTSIQNARTSKIGDALTRDGYHLSIPLGRYISALTCASYILQEPVETFTWYPPNFTDETYAIVKESVTNALNTPFAVTESQIVDNSTNQNTESEPTDAQPAEDDEPQNEEQIATPIQGTTILQISCDNAEGWQAPITAVDPYVPFLNAGGVVDTDDKKEGSASLSLVGNPNAFAGPAVNFQYIPVQSIDLSAIAETGEVRFWLYVSNPSFHVMNECQFEVTSSGTCDVNEMQWKLNTNNLKLKKGWNEVVLKVAEATSQGGECDLANVNYIRFWCLMMPADTVIKIDDIRFIGNDVPTSTDDVPESTEMIPEISESTSTKITYVIDCDSAEGWLAPKSDEVGYLEFTEAGGLIDYHDKKQGEASLRIEANPNVYGGPAVNLSYIPETNVDLQLTKETGEVRFWLYTNNANIHIMKECQFEISSSGFWDQNEMTWRLMPSNLKLQEGWNEIVLKMYKGFGFKRVGKIPRALKYLDGSFADEYKMVKYLDE